MRALRHSFLLLTVFVWTSITFAQTRPQVVRDHVYGPGGRLIVTIEPDTYPPDGPYWITASQSGPCAIDGVDLQWDTATDIGTGLSYYVSPNGHTTATSVHTGAMGGEWNTYSVYAVDHAGNAGQSVEVSIFIPLCINSLFPRRFLFAGFSSRFPDVRLLEKPSDESPAAIALRRIRLDFLRSHSFFSSPSGSSLSNPGRTSSPALFRRIPASPSAAGAGTGGER
jgi:hypothetical protein